MVKRKIVKQGSGVYTITLPKALVESMGWENKEFEVTLKPDRIVFKKV
jgi:hypothetical protein